MPMKIIKDTLTGFMKEVAMYEKIEKKITEIIVTMRKEYNGIPNKSLKLVNFFKL